MSKKGSLLSAAFTGKRKKRGGGLSLLTPATWEKRKGGTLLVRALGLKDERKRNRGHRLDAVWNKHVRAKRGTLLAIANNARLRGKQNPLLTLFDDKRRGKRKKRKLTGLARSIARAFYSFARSISRRTAATPGRTDDEVVNEPQTEAARPPSAWQRFALWLRKRIGRPPPTTA